MLKVNWNSIDKFYYIALPIVLVVLAGILIVSFRTIFSSYNESYNIDEGSLGKELEIDKVKLNEAYEWVFEKSSAAGNDN